MKEIILTKGKIALVDDEDYERLTSGRWFANCNNGRWYAERHPCHRKNEKMHRIIMNAPENTFIDHINGDCLDNRKENLRFCTKSQNNQNKHKIRGTSKYQGVSWLRSRGKWLTQIGINGKMFHIGYYDSERLAAVAYNIAAIGFYGAHAKTNEV